ncbi:MAG: class I SAM-dependent methyltransferase [Candidatus Fimimorpha sp.]
MTVEETFHRCITSELYDAILSNPISKDGIIKLKIRPIMLQKQLLFQIEERTQKQAFHKNLSASDACIYLTKQMNDHFHQAQIRTTTEQVTILVSKKGKVTIKSKKQADELPSLSLNHNRTKEYIIKEGVPVPFLIDLGVMKTDGSIVRAKYDKFRQINRFLEFIEDILPQLNKTNEQTIIDFGCGKSYLTFAMYYYLKILKGYPIRIIGLDLKKDVIAHCNALAKQYGYDTLTFLCGDIADYTGVNQVDMVVTLHACDTATDYALAKAVNWNAKVILSVPCCQHELNKQIQCDALDPALQHGLIKERLSALFTDSIRAGHLEAYGYRTQILEFIDMEHTPKNILIRAVLEHTQSSNQSFPLSTKAQDDLRAMEQLLHTDLTISRLLPLS